jgi:hypothetical protein
MAQKESEVQSAILEYLTLRGHFVLRLNNIPGFYLDAGGNKRFRKMGKYVRRGLADILIIRTGEPIFIEVKSETGKLSEEQHAFGRDVVKAGGMYIIARSIDDVQRHGL